jgi:hypothetical protein
MCMRLNSLYFVTLQQNIMTIMIWNIINWNILDGTNIYIFWVVKVNGSTDVKTAHVNWVEHA